MFLKISCGESNARFGIVLHTFVSSAEALEI